MSLPACALLGSPGRYPFNGHLCLALEADGCRLHAAARVAAGQPPELAWEAVLVLHAALARARGSGRMHLLRSAWEQILTIPPQRLGPARCQDLSVLLVAEGPEGPVLSGSGLGGIWAVDGERMRPVAARGDPCVTAPGVPRTVPPALEAPPPARCYVASCHGGRPPALDAPSALASAGIAP